MSIGIYSYSLTGNNEKLAASIAEELSAKHVKIEESKKRTMGTIAFDMLFNRTPEVSVQIDENDRNNLVLFVAPVWMGCVASPVRSCFKKLKNKIDNYAFVSISGGADGPNPKLAKELRKRTGKEPAAVIDLHIADLLPEEPKPERKDTSVYKVSDNDLKKLTGAVVSRLNELNLIV